MMDQPKRDDFSRKTIETLADRAGNRCSNPNCRKPTSGPRTDPTKAVNIGVAAHITSAAPGGPRHDPGLTSEKRSSIDNGIWLCQNCAHLIDTDVNRYHADLLRQWKRDAEQVALAEIEQRISPQYAPPFDLARYRERIVGLYGTTQIFGQPRPVPLGDLYTDVYVLDRPTAFHRFDIRQLQKDPDFLHGTKRLHGLTLLSQSLAHRLFILGKPGVGKTTFLRHIALEAAQGNLDRVPIFVTLKEWADSGDNLLPFIARQFAMCGFPQALPFIEYLLNDTDDALLLFDGLDEVQQEGGIRDRAIAALRDFSRQYNRAQCLVTCRTAATDYTFEGFAYVEVADFTAEQVEVFVHKWFHATPGKAESFLQEIAQDRHRGLRELARIPLLLAMLCLAFDSAASFPGGRAEVYRDALDVLLRHWDDSRQVHRDEIYRQLSPERKHRLLAGIAAQTFERADYFLPQHQLESFISRYLALLPGADAARHTDIDTHVVLKAIESQHGILVERAHRIYSFAHLSFQEYYAARYIVDNEAAGTLPSLIAHWDDTRWREVFFLVASLLDNADHFFRHFRPVLDTIAVGYDRWPTFLAWVARKATAVESSFRPARMRYLYAGLILVYEEGIAFRQADYQLAAWFKTMRLLLEDAALIPNLAFQLVLRHPDDADALLDFGFEFALDFTLAAMLDLALDLTHGGKRDSISDHLQALNSALRRALHLSQQLKSHDLYFALSSLSIYHHRSLSPTFASELQAILIQHRDIGHDWQFTVEEAEQILAYFRATCLLLQCLDLATVSDRAAIEDTILLPPGAWHLEDLTNK